MIKLRLATIDNASWIFDLRNDPEAYKYFLNPNPVTWEEHLEWFNKAISGHDLVIFIVYDETQAIGMVKFNINDNEAEIGINIHKDSRGMGYGSAIISAGSDRIFDNYPHIKKIIAKINEDNLPSIKTFTKAGYVLVKNNGKILSYEYPNKLNTQQSYT